MEELKKLYDVLVREGYYTNSFEDFQNKWQDENYRSKVFGVVSRDKLYTKDEASFNEKYQSTKAPSTWYGVPKEAQVGGSAPDEMSNLQESFKKKEQPVTTGLPSADGSLVPSAEPTKPIETLKNIPTKIPTPQDLPQGQGKPFEFDLTKPKPIAKEMPKTAIQKADDLITGILSEPVKGVLQFADNVLNSEKRALKDAGFFDEEIPDTNTPISDALQRKLAETKPKGTSPLDITGNLKNIVQKIINSSLSQENKNKAIKALEVVSNQTKGVISDLERYQKENLPEDNLIVDVTRGIAGMAPDLLIAAAMKNPAAAESRFAQLAEKATAKSSSFVKKVAPKAAKVLERSIKSPFTKIMAVKEGVKAMAEAKEDENPYWEAVKGSIEGAGEGMYMNVLGEAAGKVATPLARKISQSGLNSAIATTIATPLANAGVFTTAKALRTAALEQKLITPREAAMEAGTGIGFSLLHLGSQYKNQKELNHYYDNVLNDNAAHALGRVLNETKDNLDVAYNPDLTPEQVKELIDARDELKKAILKEPDMEKKQLLGAEAVKIQNQLDAHNTIADIVQNKDFIVDQLSKQENLTPDQRAFFANKTLAIADAYDMSDFAVKKRELNAKIDEAQKKLDESGNVFSNLKNASDRIYAQQEVDRRRQELEDLNAQLTELIINKTNQDAIQKQKSDEALLRAGEQRLGLRQVGEGDTQLEITPEQEKLVSDERAYYQEILDNAKDYAEEDVQDAKDYFENPVAFQEKAVKFWEDLVKEDPTEQATLDFVKSRLEAHKAAEAKPEEIQPIEVSDIEAKKADIENRRINEIGLQPLSTFASSKEQYEKDLAAWEKNKKEVDAKYDAELAALEAQPEPITVKAGEGITATTTTGKPTSITGGEGTQTMTGGVEVPKSKGTIEVKAGEGITATTTTGKPTSVTMAELPETKTAGVDVKSLPDYEKTMANVEFEVPKSKEYVEKDLKKAKERYKINKTEANKAKLDKAKADYEEYKADVEKAKERAKSGLTESATYKAADDIQKDALMRELAKKFGEKQPTAPKPEELFGNVAETAKIMEELNFLFDDANKSKDFLDEKYRKAKEALDANPTSEKLKENLRKAKAEVEEYKTKNIDEAIAKLKESESYKNASTEQQARMEKYLTDKFLKSQTSKILPTKLFEGAKDIKKVTITEKKRWADQLKAFVRGAKNTVEATKTMMSEIKSTISELSKKGSITSKQAEAIINKMASLKVSNEKGINKFIDYVSKVFADAEYGSKLSKAIETRSSISKLSGVKGKDPNLVILAKNFMAIKPSMVEDIDAYNDMASKIKESLRGTKVGGKEEPLKVAEMVKISEANKYVDEQIEAQNQKLYDEKLAEMNELFDTDLTGATFEQLLELARSDKPIDKEKETIIRDAIKKVFDTNSAIIKHIIEKGEDPFTGEKIDLSKEDIDLVKKFMGMDLNKLDIKDGIEAIDKLANFLQNGSIGNMESIIRSYQARENIDELNKKGLVAKPLKFYGSGLLGRTLGEQMATLPSLIDLMFKGFKRASEFEKMSGITELKNAKTFVQAMSTKMGNDYTKEFYERKANDKKFTDASNVAERGLIAALKRTISGTPEQQQAEFNRKKGLVEQSIDELKTGTEKEQELAKIYEDVYNKTLKDSKNIDEVISKSDKNNVEAVDWWINKWSEVYDQLATVSESVYNKILDKDLFYTPDRFSKLFEKQDPLTQEQKEEMEKGSMFHNNTGTVYKKEAGVLQKSEKPSDLPKNNNKEAERYLDLSFDKNNVNSMYDALMDIHTAGVVRQIETFFNSPGIKKIIPSAEDRSVLFNSSNNGRVQDFIRAVRNKEIVTSSELDKTITHYLNTLTSIGASTGLGSFGGIFKQTIPVAANTLINAGNIDLGYAFGKKADFLNRIGYGISVRGLESQAQISSINKLVDLASRSNGAKAAEFIDKASRLWLNLFLKNPDVFIAKASWMAYYEKALKEKGTEPSTIDYSKHEVDKDAADYAQKMVDRQQNISDADLQGKLLGSKKSSQRFIVSTLMPFASFRVNQFIRAKGDVATILSKDKMVTAEDRKTAGLSLLGYASEMAVFAAVSAWFSTKIANITNSILGRKESEEDKNKRLQNLYRGRLTGTITDVFSPIPTHIVDLAYAEGADFALDKFQDKILDIKEEDRLKLMTSSKSNELQSLGTIGFTAQKLKNFLEAKNLAQTGEFTDEYGRKKYISQKDKEAMKMIATMSFLSNFGLLWGDFNTITANAVKYAKKDASSKEGGKSEEDIQMDEQYKEQRELSKEEKQQVREQKASILQQLVSEEQDSEKADIMDRKIKEYLMTDEERIKYNEDTKSERFREKQRLKELLGEYDSKSDMKKYDPALYEERFGEGSDWYNEHQKEQEVDKQVEELMTQLEEEKYGYSGGSGDGFGKPTFGGKQTKEKPKRVTERRSFSFGSKTSNNQ